MEKLLVVILVGAVATRGSALNKAVWLWLLGVVSTGVDGLSVGTFLRAKKSWIRVLLEIGGADVLLRFRDELDSECSFSSDDVDGSRYTETFQLILPNNTAKAWMMEDRGKKLEGRS